MDKEIKNQMKELGITSVKSEFIGSKKHLLEDLEHMGRIDFVTGLHKDTEHKPLLDEFITVVYGKLQKFRLGLYLAGVDIGYKRVAWLATKGVINSNLSNKVSRDHLNLIKTDYVSKFYLMQSGDLHGVKENWSTKELNGYYDGDSSFVPNDLYATRSYLKKANNQFDKIDVNDISRTRWAIDDVFEIPDDIYELVTTINKGWQYYQRSNTNFKRLNIYRMQAYEWLDANYTMDDNWTIDRKKEWLIQERARCLTNSLYLANKYLWMKDPDDLYKGESKFTAWSAQEVVLFLIDLGFSLIIGKLRQIGFSTVIGGTMALRTMISKNFYVKMIAQKEGKSEELFEHKVKYAISKTDDFMKPSIPNWSTGQVKFGFSSGKGKEASSESTFEVCAPTEDAINAGTPKITLLDEIGFMKMFGAIIAQGRSTMFKLDNNTGKMKMTKQVIAWGTGGKTGGAGAPMEVEWKAAKEAFAMRNFRHGLIPLFLNFYAKPGHTDDFYLQEKAFYYSKKKKPGEEDPKIIFHQSFPITEDDMFLESSDTVISVASINLNIERIHSAIVDEKIKPVKGYFEPIYNMEKPRGVDNYVKYEVVGARFIPADQELIDEGSPFACCEIFERPDLSYTNRYYKGSDPIFTSSGHSKFASVIWDALKKRNVAKLNFKSEDYRFEYLQSFLLNLYYSQNYGGRKTGIRELLEFNVGGEYYNFCRELGYGAIFTGNAMLPQTLQTTTIDIGINKRGTNSTAIVNRLEEMLIDCAKNIDSLEFWIQLKTFVRKQTSTGYKYEPQNKKIHYDDEIDATVYAYINASVHSHLPISKRDEIAYIGEERKKKRLYMDESYTMRLGTRAEAAGINRFKATR